MTNHYQIADLHFTISGDNGRYFKALTEYFAEKGIEDVGAPSMLDIVVLENDDEDFEPECFSLAGSIAFNHSTFRIKKRHYTYTVSNLFDRAKPTRVLLKPTVSWILTKALIAKPEVDSHNKYRVFTSAVTNYTCLWYIFAITLMKKDQAFIHCGMMANRKNKSGIILTGTGGCGKTSLMMELITNGSYQYMAEDFGIVGKDGKLYDMQKSAAIYQSDVKWGNAYLKQAITNLPAMQRVEWKLKVSLKQNPLHYFSPSSIFGNDICRQSSLARVFYLKRAPKNTEITCKQLTAEAVAERAKTASFREMKELYEILGNIRAVGGEEYYVEYPSIHELEENYKAIFVSAFRNVSCYELQVPLNVNPKDTMKYISD